ncbi:MAG: hypothetical protein NC930_03530 [Candidatus Omnitrophica bacterium]|nr:hypothetical protein [Candidatus Omnitrophota bacterium]
METLITQIGFIGGCLMPFLNIPMILHVIKRKSARDISLSWLFGVWSCVLLMFPSALISPDIIYRIFGCLNAVLFTAVVGTVWKYRKN